jgi:uncharacterized membrane protein YgcG
MTHAVPRRLSCWLLVCGLWPFVLIPSAAAQPAPPALAAPVNDFAGVIDEGSERELDRRIRALQSASGDVVVVATVQTFQPYGDIREYAVKMFENGGRGIGASSSRSTTAAWTSRSATTSRSSSRTGSPARRSGRR